MTDKNFESNRLKTEGYKLTRQRKGVLKVLEENKRLLTAEEIFSLAKPKIPGISFPTVYRTLDILLGLKMVNRIDLGDGRSRYQIASSPLHQHYLICLQCGRTFELAECPLSFLKGLAGEDFTVVNHKFEIYGYCSACKEGRKVQ